MSARRRWVHGRARGVLAVIGALALFAAPGCGPLDRGELGRQIDAVEAVADEGGLLAHEVAQGRSKDTFVRVHADDLASQADHTEEKLGEVLDEGDIDEDLRDPAERTVELAGGVSDALGELRLDPSSELQGTRVESRLNRLSAAASHLAEDL